jgi:hypothetical protein
MNLLALPPYLIEIDRSKEGRSKGSHAYSALAF